MRKLLQNFTIFDKLNLFLGPIALAAQTNWIIEKNPFCLLMIATLPGFIMVLVKLIKNIKEGVNYE